MTSENYGVLSQTQLMVEEFQGKPQKMGYAILPTKEPSTGQVIMLL